MRILRANTIALVIDIQEKLFPHIDNHAALEKNCRILIQGLRILDIPMILTEQYPKGLGSTIAPLKILLGDIPPIEKMSFSCCGEEIVLAKLKGAERRNVLVFGIEAHVCILQTILDLPEHGFQPVVLEDCISSRKATDKKSALRRMEQTGVIFSSYESLLFELCQTAGTDEFKAISRLVK